METAAPVSVEGVSALSGCGTLTSPAVSGATPVSPAGTSVPAVSPPDTSEPVASEPLSLPPSPRAPLAASMMLPPSPLPPPRSPEAASMAVLAMPEYCGARTPTAVFKRSVAPA